MYNGSVFIIGILGFDSLQHLVFIFYEPGGRGWV